MGVGGGVSPTPRPFGTEQKLLNFPDLFIVTSVLLLLFCLSVCFDERKVMSHVWRGWVAVLAVNSGGELLQRRDNEPDNC